MEIIKYLNREFRFEMREKYTGTFGIMFSVCLFFVNHNPNKYGGNYGKKKDDLRCCPPVRLFSR
jgi:hypothetical protein